MENFPIQEKEPVHLKRATPADIPALLELEKSVASGNTYSAILSETEWQEEFQKGIIYLIESGILTVGSISYEKKGEYHAYISGLVIDPQFQGKGFGRSALTLLLQELSTVKRIDLVTHPNNTSALKLYQSVGFVVEALKENYYGDGEPRLVLALERGSNSKH